MQPSFRWTCSYQGSTWFEVTDSTGRYTAELRRECPDYEMKTANGDDVRRDMLASVTILRREHSRTEERPNGPYYRIPDSTVAAFNAWRTQEQAQRKAHMLANPDRYGSAESLAGFFPDIVPACPGHYVIGQGWTRFPVPTLEAIAA